MAFTFNGSSQYLSAAAQSLIASASAATLVARHFRTSTGDQTGVGLSSSTSSRFSMLWYSGDVYFCCANGSGSYGSAAVSGTGWRALGMSFDGSGGTNSDRLKAFVDGAPQTLTFNLTVPSTLPNAAGLGDLFIGRENANNASSVGAHAEVAMWNVALTAAEHAAFGKGFTADKIRPQSLVFYAPLVRDLIDVKGGLVITNNNGATVSEHPRVYA